MKVIEGLGSNNLQNVFISYCNMARIRSFESHFPLRSWLSKQSRSIEGYEIMRR